MRTLLSSLAAALLVACAPSLPGGAVDAGAADASDGGPVATDLAGVVEPPLASVTFTPIDDDLLNPERGFFDQVDLLGTSSFSSVRAGGHTLAYAPIVLDPASDTIPSSLLNAARAGLERVRLAGFKVVLRFAYNDCACGDAPRARVLAHLAQLTSLLADEEDVIAVLQAGFIGQWGEWHDSSSGLDNGADRKAILDALLVALPPGRMVQIRTPMLKSAALGGPLTPAEGFTGSGRARVGHHNDCFLASDDDFGTYAAPIAQWKAYVAADGAYTPVGGETCAVNAPRSACASATAEMASLHWSFLNSLYHPGVIDGWRTGGCLPEITRRLGPRFRLSAASFSARVRPGGRLRVAFTVDNDGWATPFNARPLLVVLDDGTTRRTAALSGAGADPRRWPTQATAVTATLRLPADLAPGNYHLSVWLPDASARLRDDPRYAIRFASSHRWNATTGDNELTDQLLVDPTAPGDVDPTATTLVELP